MRKPVFSEGFILAVFIDSVSIMYEGILDVNAEVSYNNS